MLRASVGRSAGVPAVAAGNDATHSSAPRAIALGHKFAGGVNIRRQPPLSVETPAVSTPERLAEVPNFTPAPIVAPEPPVKMNRSGISGLTTGGSNGLTTGSFQVTAAQPVSYSIEEVAGIFSLENPNPALLRGVIPGSFPSQLAPAPSYEVGQRRFIVMDDNVHALYGERVEKFFSHHGFEYEILALPTNEAHKSFDLVFQLAQALEEFGINRRKEPIIAIGGGVCLDVCGLAANLFRRNTPVIKVPTTLMAMVDAAIGIKTAVNFHEKKNKLGTYCPPLAVFYDRSFLRTIDHRNIGNGAAEMLKMACIKDAELFRILEEHADDLAVSKFQGPIAGVAMRRAIQGMLEELEPNLWEHVLCRVVDYGHTFSPEIEMAALASNDELLHGEAVTIDMALTTVIACNRGLISSSERDRTLGIMRALQLPMRHDVCNTGMLWKALNDTAKARDGFQRTPLMDGIGSAVFINDLQRDEIEVAAAALGFR